MDPQCPSTPSPRLLKKTSSSSNGSARSVPSYGTTPGGTVKRIARNPFERPGEIFERLQSNSPMFSPDFFKIKERDEAHSPPVFQWSLEDKALLMPAAIDERPLQHENDLLYNDPILEQKTQQAIDTFFKTRQIAPSPMDQRPPKHVLPRTPRSGPNSSDEEAKENNGTKSVSTQTQLHIPKGVDLERLLSQFYSDKQAPTSTPKSSIASGNNEGSTSLRRKLFTVNENDLLSDDGEESSVASMVTANSAMWKGASDDMLGSPLSPLMARKASQEHNSDSSLSTQFASSPIVLSRYGSHTTYHKKFSLGEENHVLESPHFSPISKAVPQRAVQSSCSQSTFDTGYMTMQNTQQEVSSACDESNAPQQQDPAKSQSIRPVSCAIKPTHLAALQRQETSMEVSCDNMSFNDTMNNDL